MDGVLVTFAAVVIGPVVAAIVVGPILGRSAGFAELVFDRVGPMAVVIVGLGLAVGFVGGFHGLAAESTAQHLLGLVTVVALLTVGYATFAFTVYRVFGGRSSLIATIAWLVGTFYPLVAAAVGIYASGLSCAGASCS